MSTTRPGVRPGWTCKVRPLPSNVDHDVAGAAICTTGTRSVTWISTPSGQCRCTCAVAMYGSVSTRPAMVPGSTLIMAG